MKKLLYLLILLLPISVFLAGCGAKEGNKTVQTNEGKLVIYTTVYPLKFLVEEIGKELVTVETVYPPGADSHNFEPSQKDMMKLADSDLFIYIGLGMEGFADKAEKVLKNEDVTLLPAGESIHFEDHEDEDHEHDEEADVHEHNHDGHDHGDINPHVWLDPIYTKDLAAAIKNELVELLPEYKTQLEENFTLLADDLDSLNEEFKTTIGDSKHKEIIVSHAAYGYWEERYGIEQISISGLSSSDEPTQKELEQIILTAKEHGLNYIFFEQNVSSKLAGVVQGEIGGESLILHNLSVLTEEDLSNNRNYFSIMRDNLAALKKALN